MRWWGKRAQLVMIIATITRRSGCRRHRHVMEVGEVAGHGKDDRDSTEVAVLSSSSSSSRRRRGGHTLMTATAPS